MAHRRKMKRARRSRGPGVKNVGNLIASSARIRTRTIRGVRRSCVEAEATTKAPGFKGRGSKRRMLGCFVDSADAKRRVEWIREHGR